jgi:uncharacterized low-complexity protein
MSQHKKTLKPLSLAIGATFIATMATTSFASAAQTNSNPFAMTDLHSGYTQLAEMPKDGKCGEGKCGTSKPDPKNAKEGKCGEGKAMPKDGKCGAEQPKAKEGKCGGNK